MTPRPDHGFSLIEVLVALAVFSVAVIGLMRLNTEALRSSGGLDRSFEARTLAENVLVRTFADPDFLREAVASGQARQGVATYQWSRIIAPTERQGLVRVTVEVRNAEGVVLERLDSLRAVP